MDTQDLLATLLLVGAGVGGYALYRKGSKDGWWGPSSHRYSTRTGLYPALTPGHPMMARRQPRGPRQRCPSNLFDPSGRCFQSPGNPSPVAGSNFDPMNGAMCQCWANVDVFGNIQDHASCYPTHDDASNKTNGFPGQPLSNQGGDYFTAVMCPQGPPLMTPPSAPGTAPGVAPLGPSPALPAPAPASPVAASGYFAGCAPCAPEFATAWGWEA